jgi:uncharacterized protein YajQ (UPF0234 family)
MNATNQKDTVKIPVIREYKLAGTKYIVSATARAGATENAATKIRRLIKNDVKKVNEK